MALPVDRVTRPADVRARRATARAALEGARAPLWTTEVDGFGGAHRLARTLGMKEVTGDRTKGGVRPANPRE
jgi:hypothetical protein